MKFRVIGGVAALLAAGMWFGIAPAHATSMDKPLNLTELVQASHDIVKGTVSKISQGRIGSTPYTEIEVAVDETIRGQASPTVTFRQLDLQSKGPAENGRVYLGDLPGMPKYEAGEHVILFLGKPGLEGFRTTVGLQQGKFSIRGGNAENAFSNQGLFHDVRLGRRAALDEKETAMVATRKGVVGAETFLGLVKRAVDQNWWGAPASGSSGGGSKLRLQNKAQ